MGFTAILYLNNSNEEMLSSYKTNLFHSFANGASVIIHEPDTFPNHINSVSFPTGHHTSLRVKITKEEHPSMPYTDCVNEENLKLSRADGEVLDMSYSSKTCEDLCRQESSIKECGCLNGNYLTTKQMRQNYTFCTKLHTDVNFTLNRWNCSRNTAAGQKQGSCFCPKSCLNYHYDIQSSFAPWPNKASLLAFYDQYIKDKIDAPEFQVYESIKDVTKLKQVTAIQENFLQISIVVDTVPVIHHMNTPAMSVGNLVGNIGGTLNLWIGITFIFLVEVFELCYTLILLFVNKKSGKTQKPV